MTEERQKKEDKMYMDIAKIVASQSYAIKRKVGSVIVKDRNIISMGYNGTISGFPNECEYIAGQQNHTREQLQELKDLGCKLITKPDVLHAEANAITKVARSNYSTEGSTIYITCSPCIECSKLIAQSGIKRVVFLDLNDTDGIEILQKANILVEQYKE